MKNIKKFIKKIKSLINKKNLKWLRYLPKTLSKAERYILSVLILVIVASGSIVWYRHYIKITHEVPAYGGKLIEGIVGEPKDFEKYTARLTNAGLTRFSASGTIEGDLAESWQIKDDNKTYEFKIRNNYSANDLLSQIENKDIWSSIDVSAPDDQTLDFKFKQPFSPFLYTTTDPIFTYGPYKITNETNSKISLAATNNYWNGKPFISNIEINLYANYDSLIRAAKNDEIMGYLKENKDDFDAPDSTVYKMNLPRELNLFFNLQKQALQDTNVRKNLRDNKPLGQDLNITLVTSDAKKNIEVAEKIKTTWKNYKANITIKTYDDVTLQKDIIPNRNYDLLLYSQDYGPDPDQYPYWHSSQISKTGLNLSDYSNKNVDKLLEDARITFDQGIRDQKYADFRKILDQDAPYINIEKASLNYVLSNKVKGVNKISGFSETDRFLNINEWYIKSKRVKN